jgi:DNA-directed RNA polymerase specialized sigma24 family protein
VIEAEKKKNWKINQAAFDGLLTAFDAQDRERAGAEYEKIRIRLIRFFEWRGSDSPEEMADETLNRIARKIEEGETIRNLSSFISGVARNVLREFYDEQARERKNLARFAEEENRFEPEEEDRRMPCFRECLDALPEAESRLLIDYYNQTDVPKIKQRRELAAKMGETANALRIRAHRIRQKLDKCIEGCLKRVK